ncbi:MAG TPA: TerC family protein [Nevskiaceae bacterium]|nr:TerC family protein [Nevskiaceae bacterium]
MLDAFLTPEALIALLTLTALEIVLGIDNIIFLSIVVAKLPPEQQPRARFIGLAGALLMRVGLLFSLSWIAGLTATLFSIGSHAVSGRDLVLLLGGLFLLWKSVVEIHASVEGGPHSHEPGKAAATFGAVIVQVMILDMVFSLDSVITAVGMTDNLPVMIVAVIISIIVMMLFARSISEFVDRHPTIKVLALSFLIMVGCALIAEGLHFHIPKGYIYFAMAFSVGVEMINIRVRRNQPKESA